MSLKRHRRYKLLLDEGVHLPSKYPNLNNLHDLVHVTQIGLTGVGDDKIFAWANKQSRIPVVFNIKDFKKFLQPSNPSIISLSPLLTDEQADLKICKALNNLKPSESGGCLISISNSGITTKRFNPRPRA